MSQILLKFGCGAMKEWLAGLFPATNDGQSAGQKLAQGSSGP